jgi:hypothetical protein
VKNEKKKETEASGQKLSKIRPSDYIYATSDPHFVLDLISLSVLVEKYKL